MKHGIIIRLFFSKKYFLSNYIIAIKNVNRIILQRIELKPEYLWRQMMHWFSGCPAVRGDIAEKKKQQEKKKRGPTYCSWQKNWHGKPTLNASLLHHSPSIPLALLHLLPNLPSPRSPLSLSLSDGWPLQYIWLIFSADWVREHVSEWEGVSRRRWRRQRWRRWCPDSHLLSSAVWSPGTAAWHITKWKRDKWTC